MALVQWCSGYLSFLRLLMTRLRAGLGVRDSRTDRSLLFPRQNRLSNHNLQCWIMDETRVAEVVLSKHGTLIAVVHVAIYHQVYIQVKTEYLRLIHIESHKNSNFCMP